MLNFRYNLGRLLRHTPYRVLREDRVLVCTANLFRLGAELVLARQQATRPIAIIQVGAFDGRFADGLEPILRQPGNYRALLVEPQQTAYQSMLDHYTMRTDICFANVAVTAEDGDVTLYTSVEGASPFATILPKHRKNVSNTSGGVRQVVVPGFTVEKLLKTYDLSDPDLLMVDTEGFDFEVVRQFLSSGRTPPSVIQLESYHLSRNDRKDLRTLLEEKKYTFADAGHDTICFHESIHIPLIRAVT